MDRRKFLKFGAAGAAAAATGACADSSNADREAESAAESAPAPRRGAKELSMVTTWPKNFPGLGDMATRTADLIGRLTEGSVTVKVFAAGELVPPFESFDAVSTGAADMYHGAEYYWQGKAKGFPFFAAVPMGLTADEMLGWIKYGGGQELWDGLSAQFNIKPFPAGNTGQQMGGWFKREIKTLEDFRGLNMRIPGLGGDVLRRLGGAAVAIPGGEIFQSLQSGAIDATEWVGPWNDLAFGFYRVAPFYYGPGFHEPGPMLSCGMNLDVWNSLTAHEQLAVSTACDWATNQSIAEYQHQNALALNTLVNDHKVQLRSFSDDIWREIQRVSAEVISEIGQSDATTKAIYESYIAARGRAMRWSSVSDGPYLRARTLGTEYERKPAETPRQPASPAQNAPGNEPPADNEQ